MFLQNKNSANGFQQKKILGAVQKHLKDQANVIILKTTHEKAKC